MRGKKIKGDALPATPDARLLCQGHHYRSPFYQEEIMRVLDHAEVYKRNDSFSAEERKLWTNIHTSLCKLAML
jgi:hypothetical protein